MAVSKIKNQKKKNEEKEEGSEGNKAKIDARAKSVPAKPKKIKDSLNKTKDIQSKSE